MVGIGITQTMQAGARTAPTPGSRTDARPPAQPGLAAAPTLVAIVLLFVAAWSDGAFALRSWGPLAVFALVALAAGRRNGLRGAAAVTAAAMFGFAAWTLLSTLWADAPGRAVEGAGRTLLYAALVALPLLTLPSRRYALHTARVLTAGVALVVLLAFAACLAYGDDWFLAGRLNDPVGYRNGTAALFALALWPLLCVAAQRRIHPLVRAACFALSVTALGMAFLTQSRGVLLGFCVGGAVALLMGPDRMRRAWLAILAVSAVAIGSQDLLAPYDAFVARGATDPEAVHAAVAALGGLAAAGFFAALVLALFDGGLRVSERHMRRFRRLATGTLALLAVTAVVGGIAAVGNPITLAADKAQEFRQLDAGAPGETRLGSTGGQRYDLWRIAWEEFRSAPVTGVGEGSYGVEYYVRRATDRNLSTPHSLPLRVLAETGVVGALLLAGALIAAVLAIVRGWPRAGVAERRWASALAAGGAVVLAQSAVDWLWLIPGLAGLALVCLATAVAIVALPADGTAIPASPRRAWSVARAIPLLAAAGVALLFLSDVYTRTARAGLADAPARRLADARTAERLNPFALAPRYLQAGALEEIGRRDAARSELLTALEREPRNFVTLGLLGDLETRAGNRAAAQGWYRRALALNPLDVGLRRLAQ